MRRATVNVQNKDNNKVSQNDDKDVSEIKDTVMERECPV